MKAFVLGAGLGTRLRPLTERRPKPLVPIHGKPLITFALDHLLAAGATAFAVNTHHCPGAYGAVFGDGTYRGLPIELRHEPVLLDTGGGIKNVEDLFGGAPFVVYNGDILADFPLKPAIREHLASGRVASLILRSSGGPLHIQCRDGRVEDIRGSLGGSDAPSYLFTGITILSPEIFSHIPGGRPVSIIPVYLDLLRAGVEVGGIVVDEGLWLDLGTREAYLDAHALLLTRQLSYLPQNGLSPCAADASIARSAVLRGCCAVGSGASVGEGAVLQDCVLWENARVDPGARLTRCIVRDGMTGSGDASARDF